MKAILLAAGFSSRMGELKQVMAVAGKPMVRQVAESLLNGGLELVVVIGHEYVRVQQALAGLPYEYLINQHPEQGMFSSVKMGCATVNPGSPCLVMPCDCPGVIPPTLHQIQDAIADHPGKVIIPTFQGRKGHPVGLPALMAAHIALLPPDTPGLSSLWRHLPEKVVYLEVNDPAILRDFDTPEDLMKADELG